MTAVTRKTIMVDLDKLAPNPWQPRAGLDPNHIRELAENIEQVGLLQLPLVRSAGVEGGAPVYEIAFGHYRIEALKHLGRHFADVEVRDLTDEQMAMIALAENTKRKDIPPIEQYRAWGRALEISGMTIQKLADTLGLDRSTVSNNLRILRLPQYVLDWVDNGELSAHGAREFLCLMGEDGHFHDEEAQLVIRDISHGGMGRPDWRVANVRSKIRYAVTNQREAEWRPLEGKAGDINPSYNNYDGGATREPTFDAAAYQAEYEHLLHRIPHYQGEGSRLWTCDAREWRRWQTRATREENAAIAANPPKAPAAPARLVRSADFAKVLERDPAAKAAVASAVAQETPKPKKGAPKATVATLTDEQRAALGSRAAPVELAKGQWATLIDGPSFLYGEHTDRPPSYFPDIEECKARCTIGATYAGAKGGGPLYLYCLNREHYGEKLKAGRDDVASRFKAQQDAYDAEDLALAELMRPHLTGPVTPWLAALLLAEVNLDVAVPRGERWGLDWQTGREFAREWGTVQRLLAVLALEDLVEQGRMNTEPQRRLQEALANAAPEQHAEVASLALAHWLRLHAEAEHIPAFIAKLQEVRNGEV